MTRYYKGNTLSDLKSVEELGIDPYLPSEKLVKAVQLAQALKRPLLLKGEPGCGKSRLAEAVAAELHGTGFREHYFEWNIKSGSKAQEGLYTIDHLDRLRNANLGASGKSTDIILPRNKGLFAASGSYIALGELGKAFLATWDKQAVAPPVILVDEIDKADIDFPNDLLFEMDRMSFKISGTTDGANGEVEITANPDVRPIFIITSNDEKPLPSAFLRRCLFHYVDFSEIKLEQIVRSKFPQYEHATEAVAAFSGWRERIEQKGIGVKNISTSELLDWVKLILVFAPGEDLGNFMSEGLPVFPQALLKDVESIQLFATSDGK